MRGLLLILLFCPTYLCLRIVSLGVPESISRGDPVLLYVNFDVEDGEHLLTVKWYKDDKVFYEYVVDHGNSERARTPGVFLDPRFSNLTHIYLYTSDLETEGVYHCKVLVFKFDSGFLKDQKEKMLTVHVIPSEPPRISGSTKRYKIGELVNMTCAFGPSKPLAEITWYINGEEAPASYAVRLGTGSPPLLTQSLISFLPGPQVHSITCVAIIPGVNTSASLELLFSAKGLKEIPHVRPGQEDPKIAGVSEMYNVGDDVDLKCSAAEQNHLSKLEWSINNETVPPEFLSGDGVSSLGLHFNVTADHWKSEGMSLMCTATSTDLVLKTSEYFTDYSSIAIVISPSLLWLVLLLYFI